MGYETTLIFVSNGYKPKFKGYCGVEATLKMGKIAYDALGELIQKTRIPEAFREEMKKLVEDKRAGHAKMFNSEGNYNAEYSVMPEEKRRKIYHRLIGKIAKQLDAKIPYIYYDDMNDGSYTDAYGDFLMLVTLAELKKAVELDRAKMTLEGGGYRRFDMALKLIETFEHDFGSEEVRVVMWGH